MPDYSVISSHIQECVVSECIRDKTVLAMVRRALDPSLVTSEVVELALRTCYDYYDNFDDAPDIHFSEEFKRRIDHMADSKIRRYTQWVEKVKKLDRVNQKYVLSRVNEFVKAREFGIALVEAEELVEAGKFNEARVRMYQALKAGVEREEVGVDYTRDMQYLRSRVREEEYIMSTGIDILDNIMGGGFSRSQFISLLGAYKGCKSWFLLLFAKMALVQGLNVAYISHENPDKETIRRFDMTFMGRTSKSRRREVRLSEAVEVGGASDENSRFEIHDDWEMVDSIWDDDAVVRFRRKLEGVGGRSRLMVKKFPMGTASVMDVESYLDYLEQFHNVTIDVLINDYADIMRPITSFKDNRDRINETYIHHKRLADSRNIVVVTASQCTRDAIHKDRMSPKDWAEDIRKMGNVDIGLAVCQTEKQKEEEIASIHVIGSRSTVLGGATVGMCLDIGQPVLWSVPYGSTVEI